MIELTNREIWTGRLDDEDGELGTRWHQIVESKTLSNLEFSEDRSLALLGFCSDEGVRRNKGRTGARNSPNLIKKALANLPFNPEKQMRIFDFGNIILENQNLEAARKVQKNTVSVLTERNYFPVVLGGGHETALGDFLGLAERYKNIGIINIDAHYDIRIPVENSTSGTPFFEMYHHCQQNDMDFNYFVIGIQETGNTQALFSRAEEMGVTTVLADEVHSDLNNSLLELEEFISRFDAIYLSLDLDVLDAAFAPGVSAPCVNGLNAHQVKSIIQKILSSGKVRLFDVVEMNPEYDRDNITAKLAASMVQLATFK